MDGDNSSRCVCNRPVCTRACADASGNKCDNCGGVMVLDPTYENMYGDVRDITQDGGKSPCVCDRPVCTRARAGAVRNVCEGCGGLIVVMGSTVGTKSSISLAGSGEQGLGNASEEVGDHFSDSGSSGLCRCVGMKTQQLINDTENRCPTCEHPITRDSSCMYEDMNFPPVEGDVSTSHDDDRCHKLETDSKWARKWFLNRLQNGLITHC